MRERGVSLIKLLIIVSILFLIGFFVTKLIIMRYHYQSLKEKVNEQARFAGTISDDEILEAIVSKGKDVNVKLEKRNISLARIPGDKITIRLAYPDSIVMPLQVYAFRYNFKIEETAPLPR